MKYLQICAVVTGLLMSLPSFAKGNDSSGGDAPLRHTEFICQTKSPKNGFKLEITRSIMADHETKAHLSRIGDDSLVNVPSVTDSTPRQLDFESPAFVIHYYLNNHTVLTIHIEEPLGPGVYSAQLSNGGADQTLPDTIDFICTHS